MTKYLEDGPFGTGVNSDAYRDGWERTFGKKRCAATPCHCGLEGCGLRYCRVETPCQLHACSSLGCRCPPPETK